VYAAEEYRQAPVARFEALLSAELNETEATFKLMLRIMSVCFRATLPPAMARQPNRLNGRLEMQDWAKVALHGL